MLLGEARFHIIDTAIPANKRGYWYVVNFKTRQPNFPKDRKEYTKRVAVTTNSQARAKELVMAKLKHLHPFAIKVSVRHG
jgi:hypothetical protein